LPLVIREPIRSGQIVYAEKNDLIVIGPVNPGAQLIADGNIHVYSRLRGRAVGGGQRGPPAPHDSPRREGELVGIDSVYLTADDIPAERLGLPAQIFVDSGRCVIAPL
jgi:septum site-determining protein MinC